MIARICDRCGGTMDIPTNIWGRDICRRGQDICRNCRQEFEAPKVYKMQDPEKPAWEDTTDGRGEDGI